MPDLFVDAAFVAAVAKLPAPASPRANVPSPAPDTLAADCDALVAALAGFNTHRRRETTLDYVELDPLGPGTEAAAAAVGFDAYLESLRVLETLVADLVPHVTPALIGVLALAADRGHPLTTGLRNLVLASGFTDREWTWIADELARGGPGVIDAVCPAGVDDLRSLIAGARAGGPGAHPYGFMRPTGDPATDDRIGAAIVRMRLAGMTASVYHVLIVAAVASVVAHARAGSPPRQTKFVSLFRTP